MPTATEYNQAIQNLRVTAGDEELKRGQPVSNAMGLPIQYAGNFAVVYQVECPDTGKTWAVKCFTKQAAHRRERYAAISHHLRRAGLPPRVLKSTSSARGRYFRGLAKTTGTDPVYP